MSESCVDQRSVVQSPCGALRKLVPEYAGSSAKDPFHGPASSVPK